MRKHIYLFLILSLFSSCNEELAPQAVNAKRLTIFFVNDQHGKLDNFAKIKNIIDEEKKLTNALLACSGDIFSGNPVVDNHEEKGFPIIDVMNRVGFDISVLGNHEFDYGEDVLKKRMEQANFDWVCANVDMGNTGIPEPAEYKTLTVGGLNITFLGLVETNGKQDATIPSTHPWRVKNLTFQRPEQVITQYASIKAQENSDLFIALTHLGHSRSGGQLGDYQLAEQYPYFDLIIGGHSHQRINELINEIPVVQSGANLNYLGKIELEIKNQALENFKFELIDLNAYTAYDTDLKTVIDQYNASPSLNEVVGFAQIYHNGPAVGCFYTDALKGKMQVDLSFQNTGGIRSGINQGDITQRDIFEVDPFNNGTIIYQMSVADIKTFLKGSNQGFYYSGLNITQLNDEILIKDLSGSTLANSHIISIGINDYIPAVFDNYFPPSGNLQSLSSAETVIAYLKEVNSTINYTGCSNYFQYQ